MNNVLEQNLVQKYLFKVHNI